MIEDKKLTVLVAMNDKTAAEEVNQYLKNDERFLPAYRSDNFLEIESSIRNRHYDLILADVEFGSGNNLRTIFDILKTCKNPSPVILFSDKKKWAAKAFYYEAIDYIVYPLRFNRIAKSIKRYLQLINATISQSVLNRRLCLHQRGNQIFLDTKEIVFAVSCGKKSIIYTTEEQFEIFILLKDLYQYLDNLGFVRVHKRYIVNRYYIKSFNQSGERDKVARINHPEVEYIPIGRSYYKNLDAGKFTTCIP